MNRRRANRRDVDGILLLDKPAGYSSNQALSKAKRLFRAAKAGHTGSLDPMATGMLVVCFGQATKVSGLLLDASKRYQATLRLGQASDSLDADGALSAPVAIPDLTEAEVGAAIASFEGEGTQIPPMYSALKHQGQRLYTLARAGQEVERAARNIVVHEIRLLRFDPPDVSFDVHCSKGTYVRVLGADIAQSLGTQGHLIALRRTGLGPFSDGMRSFAELEAMAERGLEALDGVLLPADSALSSLRALTLSAEGRERIVHGQAASCAADRPCGQQVRLYGPNGRFLGLGEIRVPGEVAPKRLFLS